MMERLGAALWNILEGLLHFTVYKILHIKLRDEMWEKLLQFVKFSMVGFSNVIVSYGVYLIFFRLFQFMDFLPDMDYLVAQWIGYVLSIFWAFYWNRKYVFAEAPDLVPWYTALVKSFIAYSFTGVFLNSVLSFLWVEIMGISKIVAPIISLIINVPVNFMMNKFWAFREKAQ